MKVHSEFSAELETAWRSLQSECDHYAFQSYEWLSHWHRTVGASSGVQPAIAVVSEHGREVALFPFGIRMTAGVRSLEFLGGGQSDYNAILAVGNCSGAPELERIWAGVLAALPRHDVRRFVRLPSSLPDGPNPVLGIWETSSTGAACAASLAQSWEEQQQRIPKRVRSDSKRQLRKVEAQGEFTFSVATEGSDFDEIVAAMIEQKRRRYLETGVRDAFADEATRGFYRGLRGSLGGRGRIHLSALRVNGAIIATHWGMVYDDRFYYLQPSYAAGIWRSLSAGRLLQERLMEWAIRNGLKWFDLSVGDEPYKKIWCDRQMELYDSAAAVTGRGRVYIAAVTLQRWLKTNKTTRAALTALVRAVRGGARRPARKDPSAQ